MANNFSRKSPFYWRLGISRFDEMYVEWNNSNLKFPINNAEVSLSYRHQFTSRSPAMRRFSMEYQLGVAASLTENKFIWAELGEEKYFSETGDVSGYLAISAHYQMTTNISAIMGVKHFPKMSEFGSISSVFLGLKFNLDFSPKYYGN
jgi:hemolysin activation/secretion protein